MNHTYNNIFCLSSSLSANGVQQVVTSPGSRNAPLVVGFVRNPHLVCYSQIDERSAGYMGLGLAKQSNRPVVVNCTSGTAVLNYYPAIAEAFYSGVPLIIITADRPPELIDRWDGQAIRQEEVFKNHILRSFSTPDDMDTHDRSVEIEQLIEAAVELASSEQGPVHVNIPLREPLYLDQPNKYDFKEADEIQETTGEMGELSKLGISGKTWILNGASHTSDKKYDDLLKEIRRSDKALILNDIISNLTESSAESWDNFKWSAEHAPDLLITTGRFVLSKNMKQFLRKHKPQEHIHIGWEKRVYDPFYTEPKIIEGDRTEILSSLLQDVNPMPGYLQGVRQELDERAQKVESLLDREVFSEFHAARMLIRYIDEGDVIHLANSTSVRYFSYLKHELNTKKVHSNRGTSGIDGCTSTAIGMAMNDQQNQHYLITGDVAFFYDVNALWRKQLPNNLKIVLMNNFGGGIFRYIDGPNRLPELEEFLETQHGRNGLNIANDLGVNYYLATSKSEMNTGLEEIKKETQICVLEVQTDRNINQEIFNEFKKL